MCLQVFLYGVGQTVCTSGLLLQGLLEGTAGRPENGIYFAGAPENKLLTWPYVNKNALYYDSSEQAAVALTDAERAQQVQVRAQERCSLPEEIHPVFLGQPVGAVHGSCCWYTANVVKSEQTCGRPAALAPSASWTDSFQELPHSRQRCSA